ncbi:MAG: putative RND superfamily exporter protein, partial [Saprospiraceae bacterium]
MDFWTRISRGIIKGRFLILLLLGIATYFMTTQWQYMRFSYTEANLMPKDHEVNIQYDKFLEYFGEEGNVIVIAVKDSTFFTPEKFNNWNALAKTIDSFPEIDYTIAIGDIRKLTRDDINKKFITEPLYNSLPSSSEE